MKYSKISTINNVSTYFLKDNFLFFDSGKQLQEHILFMNNELIGLKGLTELKLPATIEKIDLAAFENSALTELHCRAIIPPTVNRNFGYKGRVIVPYRSVDAYKQAIGWQDCAIE